MVWEAGSDLKNGGGDLFGGAGKAARVNSKELLPHTFRGWTALVVSESACLRRGRGGVGGEGALLRCLPVGVGESRKEN